ncbi:hypothetical protein SDC9_125811 [bioreactor metagenome]|uniref:VRR-NUC domain-containing protein n=1 Tax=bioreactor metagenome TaxID=1076179 RepID=A0A645CPG3_9ZZZZ
MATTTMPIPTESVEQQILFRWARMQRCRYPELDLLYHIPNGGSRKKAEAGRFKAEGVKAGIPDIFLPVPRDQYHGLYIELKRTKGGRISPEQVMWMEALTKQGYCCAVCKGHEAAIKVILDYLEGRDDWIWAYALQAGREDNR